MQSFFAYLAGKAIFRRRARANRRGILDAMNREHGYTLMETLVTLTPVSYTHLTLPTTPYV